MHKDLKRGMGWSLVGGGLGALSLSPIIDPLGLELAVVVTLLLITWRFRTPAAGLLLVGAGMGAIGMLAGLYRPYPGTFTIGVPLSLGVIAIGLTWLRPSYSLSATRGRPGQSAPGSRPRRST